MGHGSLYVIETFASATPRSTTGHTTSERADTILNPDLALAQDESVYLVVALGGGEGCAAAAASPPAVLET